MSEKKLPWYDNQERAVQALVGAIWLLVAAELTLAAVIGYKILAR